MILWLFTYLGMETDTERMEEASGHVLLNLFSMTLLPTKNTFAMLDPRNS